MSGTTPAKWFEYGNSYFTFAERVYREQRRAADKFPAGERLLGALMEEVGEAANALLQIKEAGGDPQRVYDELVQVAATAFRLAVLGDTDYGYAGTKCHHMGCLQNTVGGPCPLCYE